jgi:exodeoxyribonuclease VII large subunit
VELAAPDYHAVHNELMNAKRHMIRAVDYRLSRYQNTFDTLSSRPCLRQPMRLVEEKEMRLDTLRERLLRTSEVSLTARNRLNEYMHAMKQLMSDQSSVLRAQLNNDVSALRLSAEKAKLKEESRLRTEKNQLLQAVKLQDERKRTEMKHTMALLDAYSPLKVLERGYSVVSKEGHVISSAADLHVKDEITVRMADGQIRALVKETEGKK